MSIRNFMCTGVIDHAQRGGQGVIDHARTHHARTNVLFICLLAVLMVACSSGPAQKILVKAPANKQVYRVPQIGADITTLDPALVLQTDQASLEAIQMLYTGLVSLDDHLQVVPQLALSWDVSPDGFTWTFHLHHNLKFSDGTPLTSSDVAYSIDRALQPATKSSIAPIYLALIKDSDKLLAGFTPTLINDSLLTPDSNTLVIVTNKKAPYFLDMLTYPCSYVVEKSLITTYITTTANFTDHLTEGGSSGPFKVSQFTHRVGITFVPNPNYYGPHPQLGKVVFSLYQDTGTAYFAYLRGQVDTAPVPLTSLSLAKKRNDFHHLPLLWINYYTMNYLVPPFDNINIRQAFELAINKTAIANKAWQNTVIPTNHILPTGMIGYNSQLTGPDSTQSLTGNASKAKALLQKGLQQEGWTSVSQIPPITLTYASGSPNTDNEVNMMVQMWQQVLGISVTAAPTDYNSLLSQTTLAIGNLNGLQFWGLSWVAEYPNAQDWLTNQFDKGNANNAMNYGQNTSTDVAQQQQLQQELEAADANSNTAARLKAYQQAEQQLVNDVAWLPMEQETALFVRQPTVVGIVDNAQQSIPPLDWANIYIGQYQ